MCVIELMVCIYVYVYIYIYIYVHNIIQETTFTSSGNHLYQDHLCPCPGLGEKVAAPRVAYMYVYIYIHIYNCIYLYIYIYTHTHIHNIIYI